MLATYFLVMSTTSENPIPCNCCPCIQEYHADPKSSLLKCPLLLTVRPPPHLVPSEPKSLGTGKVLLL